MRLTRRQLRRLILKEARAMSIATVPDHPSPRTHETPAYQSGSFFTVRRQPMGRGYGRIAKDYLFYVQMDSGESIRIPHQMHRPITSKRDAVELVNLLADTFMTPMTLANVGEIPRALASSEYSSDTY